jgi:hypothetical protein
MDGETEIGFRTGFERRVPRKGLGSIPASSAESLIIE